MPDPDPDRRWLPAPRRALDELRARVAARDSGALGAALAERLVGRAEAVLDRLDGVAHTMERVARAELALIERLEPIVDDLGELVKLQLEDARRRLGRPGRRRDD